MVQFNISDHFLRGLRTSVAICACVLMLMIALTSCTSVSSKTKLAKDRTSGTSFGYMLPKAFVPIELYEFAGQFVINAGAVTYVGDPAHFYYGYYNPSPFSSDSLNVAIGANGLLDQVNMEADDRSGAVLINLARSAAALQGAGIIGKESNIIAGATKIAEVDIDPDDLTTIDAASQSLSAAANHRIRAGVRNNCGKSENEKIELCGIYSSLKRKGFRIAVDSDVLNLPKQVRVPDCSVGVCFRLPIPYRISAGFQVGRKGVISSAIVPLPNGGPIVATNFRRTLFVKKVINADYTDGVLTNLIIQKPSEAEQIALLPQAIISAFFTEIASTFTSRTEAINAELLYIQKFQELSEKKAAAQKESDQVNNVSLLSVSTGGKSEVFSPIQNIDISDDQDTESDDAASDADRTTPDCTSNPSAEDCLNLNSDG